MDRLRRPCDRGRSATPIAGARQPRSLRTEVLVVGAGISGAMIAHSRIAAHPQNYAQARLCQGPLFSRRPSIRQAMLFQITRFLFAGFVCGIAQIDTHNPRTLCLDLAASKISL